MAIGAPGRELFVISDLHLGGEPPPPHAADTRGFRLCTQTAELARFIRLVAGRCPQPHPVELVINGDFIDFLAHPQPQAPRWRAFLSEPVDALRVLQDVARRDVGVFDALAAVLAAGHSLTLMLGNHDVELSFPRLRQWLQARLGCAEGERLRFIYDGEAYTVGRLLIEHGNRYDGFNVTDHDGLRRLRSVQSRGQSLAPAQQFTAPPGSELVARLMNPLKESRFQFVDLLKPEVAAVLPLLLALEPTLAAQAPRLVPLKARALWHGPAGDATPRRSGDISAPLAAGAAAGSLDDWLRELLGEQDAQGFLADLRGPASGDIASAAPRRRLKALHIALKRLAKDRSFDRATESASEYLQAAQTLNRAGFDCIAFGHTHLAKQVALDAGGLYLNSGTWADLIQLPPDCASPDAAVAHPAIEALLDRLARNALDGLVLSQPTYLHLVVAPDERVSHASLRDFRPTDTELG